MRDDPAGTTASLLLAIKAYKQGETLNGEHAGLGFLFLYELFTEAKRVRFTDKDEVMQSRGNHTFAALLFSLFASTGDGLRESILSVLSRNPWVCKALPKWRDTRTSDHGKSPIRWRGDIKSKADPLSRLYHDAMRALADAHRGGYLLPDELPPHGFVPPKDVAPWLERARRPRARRRPGRRQRGRRAAAARSGAAVAAAVHRADRRRAGGSLAKTTTTTKTTTTMTTTTAKRCTFKQALNDLGDEEEEDDDDDEEGEDDEDDSVSLADATTEEEEEEEEVPGLRSAIRRAWYLWRRRRVRVS